MPPATDVDPRLNELAVSIQTAWKIDDRAADCSHIPDEPFVRALVRLYTATAFPQLGWGDGPEDGAQTGLSGRDAFSGHGLQRRLQQLQEGLARFNEWALLQPDRSRPTYGRHAAADQAGRIAAAVLEQLPATIRLLQMDLDAAYDGDPACRSREEVLVCYPGFRAILVHRLAHQLYRLDSPLAARILAEWIHSLTGIDIHPGATIGHHFFIDHGTGVVIGETCRIGNHVRIYQGVTLGALNFPRDSAGALVRDNRRHPSIGDHVVIYASASILGGETEVGAGSVIGSSVWLTESVPPGSRVVMEKPRLKVRTPGVETGTGFFPDFQI